MNMAMSEFKNMFTTAQGTFRKISQFKCRVIKHARSPNFEFRIRFVEIFNTALVCKKPLLARSLGLKAEQVAARPSCKCARS